MNTDPVNMPGLAGEACVGLIAPGWVPVLGSNPDSKKYLEVYRKTFPKETPRRLRGGRVHRRGDLPRKASGGPAGT